MTIDARTLSADEYKIARANVLKESGTPQTPPVGDDVRKLSAVEYEAAKRDILKKIK